MIGARAFRVAAAFALPIVLAGCVSGKRISDIDAPSSSVPESGAAWSVPAGVVVNARDRGSLEIDGLYPSTEPDDRRCCWIATTAAVLAREPSSASIVVVTVLVPDYPFFEDRAQSLSVTLGGQRTVASGLAPGVHRIEIPVPSGARRSGFVRIGLHTSLGFVPAREHVNADTRSLGIILLGIAFR